MCRARTTPEAKIGHYLFGSSTYCIHEFIGEGVYGKVAKCRNLATKEMVAVKILKQSSELTASMKNEIFILTALSALDPDRINVVKLFEHFEDRDRTCLAFEMLETNLHEFIANHNYKPLSLQIIRPIANQLLVAFDALKFFGILHGDLKADNIMIVHRRNRPVRVKLIDFGLAKMPSEVRPAMVLQAIGYRAPEVSLGLPFNEAIDMWGLGCTLACLYLARHLFPVNSEYQMMKRVVELLGQPKDYMLEEGLFTESFFHEVDGSWRLLMPEEHTVTGKVNRDQLSCLDDLVDIRPKKGKAEYQDRKAFVDLLKGLLHIEGDKRLTPEEALQHPFITMSHLVEDPHSRVYLAEAQTLKDHLGASADRLDISAVLDSVLRSATESPESREDAEADEPLKEEDVFASSRNDEPEIDSVQSTCIPPPCSDSEDSGPSSCHEQTLTDSTPAAPASSGRGKKILRRISKFLRRVAKTLCCCCNWGAWTLIPNEGVYGKVAKCRNLATKEMVAVKILKQSSELTASMKNEIFILTALSALDPDRINVVKLFEHFEDRDRTCLAFEMVEKNLHEIIAEHDYEPLSLQIIRPIANQLLVAFDALKFFGILHGDLKADNIMIVHRWNRPLRVKLIDFGLAKMPSEVRPAMVLQAIGYRAPEVSLGLPFNEAIDMWGLGCTLACLYLARHLFPANSEYQMTKRVVELLGQPKDYMLEEGLFTGSFFNEVDGSWRLLMPEEHTVTGEVNCDQPSCLDDLVDIHPKEGEAEYQDRKAFVVKAFDGNEAWSRHLMSNLSVGHLQRQTQCRAPASHHPALTVRTRVRPPAMNRL
ncbi:uncharacterized protein LOC117810015 [Xyrichtys novacula]|uniref:Uncharacterized protein LOC117810015 n=1 Tax=Xyrichtys novacula TaxID=13765 RepID=A0AAV1EJ82_XYRNO|nr:uncharacterized protein LOC117810015 [Xyrichtys novacula]